MNSKLATLSLFELKRSVFSTKTWINNAIFLLINMSIFPFTMKLGSERILDHLFLSIVMTSMLLGIVLITSHIFDEDANDGSIDQYLTFGVKFYMIYLSKVIVSAIEFALITALAFPLAGLFYSVSLDLVWKIWLAVLLSTPILASVTVFGSMLTINLHKNSAVSVLLMFPLLISALIILSLAAGKIIDTASFTASWPYLEMNIGLGLLIIPLLCWLSKHLH